MAMFTTKIVVADGRTVHRLIEEFAMLARFSVAYERFCRLLLTIFVVVSCSCTHCWVPWCWDSSILRHRANRVPHVAAC